MWEIWRLLGLCFLKASMMVVKPALAVRVFESNRELPTWWTYKLGNAIIAVKTRNSSFCSTQTPNWRSPRFRSASACNAGLNNLGELDENDDKTLRIAVKESRCTVRMNSTNKDLSYTKFCIEFDFHTWGCISLWGYSGDQFSSA